MAFTGTPTVQSLGTNVVRITGLSLAAAAAGTIGLNGGAGQVSLPSNFPTGAANAALTLADVIEVRFQRGVGGTQASHIDVTKVASPFLLTLTNPDGANASGPLDIYVQYFHTIGR